MKFVKSTNFRRHVAFLWQTHAVSGFENMTSLRASCWNCNRVLKAFKMSFEMDQLSGNDSSSSSKFGSSDEKVHELLVEQEALSDVRYAVKEILKVYILQNKLFALDELNNRIFSFDYGYHNESNKSANILRKKLLSDDHNLIQHGKLNIFII